MPVILINNFNNSFNDKAQTNLFKYYWFTRTKNMENVTNAIGNPTALLIERIFWLGLGLFLGLGIITSVIRGLTAGKKKKESTSEKN